MQCHGPTGLGDGQQTDFDNWSKANKEFIDKTDDACDGDPGAEEATCRSSKATSAPKRTRN